MRVSFPRRGWMELHWREDEASAWFPHFERLFGEDFPGIRVMPLALHAHESTWHLLEPHIEDSNTRLKMGMHLAGLEVRQENLPAAYEGLYPWQKLAVQTAIEQSGLLLCDDMGLGKTRSAAVAAQAWCTQMGYHSRPRVIVGPAFARAVWRQELEAAGLLDRPEDYCVIRSVSMDDSSYDPAARWYFINYEIAHAWATHFSSVREARRPIAAILDEAHRIKNPRARRTKGAVQLAAPAKFRILLTGTPVDNRPAELWQLLTVLEGKYSYGTYGQFRRRYCGAVQGDFGLEDREPTNVNELRRRMMFRYLRRTASQIDVSLMPKLTRQRIELGLTEAQRKKHDTLARSVPLEELLAALLEGRAGPDTFEILGRLRKITSAAKIPTTAEHVSELLEGGESVVVFAWQKATAHRIAQGIPCSSVPMVVTGDVPQEERAAAVRDYQALEGPRVLVATYGALAEGVTLTKANRVVLHDLDFKLSPILQAERRVARIGQTKPCVASWVLAENSIDTIFARLLLTKSRDIESTVGISEPAQAVAEIGIEDLAQELDASVWAREMMQRMEGGR